VLGYEWELQSALFNAVSGFNWKSCAAGGIGRDARRLLGSCRNTHVVFDFQVGGEGQAVFGSQVVVGGGWGGREGFG
jgi:hypothetical protein